MLIPRKSMASNAPVTGGVVSTRRAKTITEGRGQHAVEGLTSIKARGVDQHVELELFLASRDAVRVDPLDRRLE